MHHPNSKKLKAKLMLARNKRNQMIFQHARTHASEHARIQDAEAALLATPPEKTRAQKDKDDEIWSEKTQDIRNRLTSKKRQAKDRWNRFAGTEGGGGMGR